MTYFLGEKYPEAELLKKNLMLLERYTISAFKRKGDNESSPLIYEFTVNEVYILKLAWEIFHTIYQFRQCRHELVK